MTIAHLETAAPVRNRQNEIKGAVTVLRDMTATVAANKLAADASRDR